MKIKLSNSEILAHALTELKNCGFAVIGAEADGENGAEFTGDRFARKSFGQPYICHHDWPLDCFVQCGENGMVLTGKPSLDETLSDSAVALEVVSGKADHYRTAFFEAFPKNPDAFLRGEGKSLEAAEESCWQKLQRIIACPKHEFERRDRVDGYAFCIHCKLSGTFMDPLKPCAGCQATSYKYYGTDKDGLGYCEACYKQLPEEKLPEIAKKFKAMLREA